jgi:orotidine-5'-phosphate decarboxylase
MGDKIIGLKIHSEILSMNKEQEARLIKICKQSTIFLWEDRKMNDIAATVEKQIRKYEKTRDFISIAPTSGPHVLAIPSSLGFFIVAEMSSIDNCFTGGTSARIASYIDKFPYNVCGVICQDELWFDLPFLSIKPGISCSQHGDGRGQQYSTISGKRPDLYVIGRAIVDSEVPEEAIHSFLK